MAFEDAADLAGFFDPADFAVGALYYVQDNGIPITLRVIVDFPVEDAGGLGEPGGEAQQVTALIIRNEVGTDPARGDVLVVNGVFYLVENARPEGTQAIWRLILSDYP